MFTEVQEAVRLIEQRRKNKRGNEGFCCFMKQYCPAYQSLPIIHIAGTNGKGSTTSYLRSMLQAMGKRVGTLTSPALLDHRDRIRINDTWISESAFLRLANQFYDQWEAFGLSMFEIDVHLALSWFLQEQVDIVVLETGLGGRLDATNIVTPLISVITNIGHDHMHLLGDTLEAIAMEKAGIIKEGVLLVTAVQQESCLAVLAQECQRKHTSMKVVSIPQGRGGRSGETQYFDYAGMNDLELSTAASYQIANAALAVEALRQLYPDASETAIRSGLKQARWDGRFQIMQKDPCVIVDGAHNPEGIAALYASLQPFSVDTILFSVLQDKAYDVMINMLRPIAKRLILCDFKQERAADCKALAKAYQLEYAPSLQQALKQRCKQDDCIVICGSLYFVSEAYRLFHAEECVE